jgi:hypothetical protein
MALGCACKLYSLHTVGYRNALRLTQSVSHSSSIPSTSSLTQPLINNSSNLTNELSNQPSNNVNSSSTAPAALASSNNIFTNLASLLRRPFNQGTNLINETTTADNLQPNNSLVNSILLNNNTTATTLTTSTINELPLPHHSIAPPTYNQTMGLVDEYEQRQLAFIDHVRSILSQQQ